MNDPIVIWPPGTFHADGAYEVDGQVDTFNECDQIWFAQQGDVVGCPAW